MDLISKLQSITLWQNTAWDYFKAAVIFILLVAALKIFQMIILSRLKKLAKKTKTDVDDMAIEIFNDIWPPFYLIVALYVGVQILILPEIVNNIFNVVLLVVVIYEIVRAIDKIVEFIAGKYIKKQGAKNEAHAKSMIRIMKIMIKAGIWIIGLIMVLGNLGIDVTSLIAGLGIGGIAVALALQNILSDLFSSFSIYLDKPFKIGDYIVVGSDSGTVEKIGIKSTRLRTLQGEQMIISNKELTTARVQNFQKMKRRRVVFNLGVVYGTKQEKLAKIPQLTEDIISKIKKAKFDRCHFESMGDYSLNFELVYFAETDSFDEHMAIKQEINLKIYETFEQEGISFAFPSQSIYMEKII